MKIEPHPTKLQLRPSACREDGAALFAYLFILLIVVGTIAAIAGYVTQNMQLSQRRQELVNAIQFAQSGAAAACEDLARAYTNATGFPGNLTATANGSYVKNSSLSVGNQVVYERTITGLFTNQSVQARVWMTNSGSPNSAKILASATVGRVTQAAQINVEMKFLGYAIISTAQGNTSAGISKANAQTGNVVVDGGNSGTTKINGGILANGNAVSNLCQIDDISKQNYGTSSQIPDYTSPGSLYQLFDFNRFIAVADLTGNHYTNASAFVTAAAGGAVLEGIIVIDLPKSGPLPTLSLATFPSGINVRGTLLFNFTGAWLPLDKIVNTATMNINAANLGGLVPGNPTTYPTGFPPTYSNSAKNPINVDITSKGFENFTAADNLPALMYNNAILDIHGNANICGVVYSSSFMEIENKQDGQTQYFNGALIGGGGIYVENGRAANSIVTYDPKAVGNLATAGGRGKSVVAVYRQ